MPLDVFWNFQFPPFRRDRNSKGGRKFVYAKQEIIVERVENLETTFSETYLYWTISRKNYAHYLNIGPQNK